MITIDLPCSKKASNRLRQKAVNFDVIFSPFTVDFYNYITKYMMDIIYSMDGSI